MLELLCSLLNSDKPDYIKAAEQGAEAIPYLLKLVKKADPRLAHGQFILQALLKVNNQLMY